MNAALFFNNPDLRSYVSLVPTSAHTGDGMGDLISQVVRLTQTRLAQRLSFSEELQSMVLEVRHRTFHASGTRLWNSLDNIRKSVITLSNFRKHIYNCNLETNCKLDHFIINRTF